jgi:hypothetical protein
MPELMDESERSRLALPVSHSSQNSASHGLDVRTLCRVEGELGATPEPGALEQGERNPTRQADNTEDREPEAS